MTDNLYAQDGLCHNAQRGHYGHECGKPAVWLGTKRSGWSSGFCDRCRTTGDEALAMVTWARHPKAPPPKTPREHADTIEATREMGCNCDLDNWEPERSTGHSRVCRIHKAALSRATEA